MKLDELEKASIDFIANGGDLPSGLKADERFKATSHMLRHICENFAEHVGSKEKHQTIREQITLKIFGLFLLAVACVHTVIPADFSLWELIKGLLP